MLVRQVLGAIAQFEKTSLVAKLKAARDRKRLATGKCGGRRLYVEDILHTQSRNVLLRNGPTSFRSLHVMFGRLEAMTAELRERLADMTGQA